MYGTITFLTDFGLQDDFAGVCRGVIKRISRDVQIIDITHGIAAQNVMQGALVLARSMPFMPVAVNLAVVDPGVGGDRRAVAIRTADERIFVGPDNGLLSLAADAGSVVGVRALTNPAYHLERVSSTFHARDVFAPVAAHIADGASFDDLGDEVDPGDARPDRAAAACRRRGADRRDRARGRPLREPAARTSGTSTSSRPASSSATGSSSCSRPRRTTPSSPGRSSTPGAATCSCTRTRTARTRSRSRAATRAS